MSELQKIEKRISTFDDMPTLCATLAQHINNPDADIGVLTKALQFDPGITANILHLANSAYYGIPHTVSSLHDAVIRIGLNRIMQLVMARGIAGTLRRPLKGYDLEPEEMLLHAAWVAIGAEEFCKISKQKMPATVFTAGLLHDIGKLILDEFILPRQTKLDAVTAERNITHYEAETVVLGINHAEAGARILEQWGLPDELIAAARWHHAPEKADKCSNIVNIIHLANTLAHTVGIGAGREESVFEPSPHVMEVLHINRANIEYVASQTLDKMRILHKILIT